MRKLTTLNHLRFAFSLQVEDKVYGCQVTGYIRVSAFGIHVRERYSAPVLFRFPEIFALINSRFLFTQTGKIPRKGHLNDLSNEYKIISVPKRIFSKKKDF